MSKSVGVKKCDEIHDEKEPRNGPENSFNGGDSFHMLWALSLIFDKSASLT